MRIKILYSKEPESWLRDFHIHSTAKLGMLEVLTFHGAHAVFAHPWFSYLLSLSRLL